MVMVMAMVMVMVSVMVMVMVNGVDWGTPALNKLIDPDKRLKNVFIDSLYVT